MQNFLTIFAGLANLRTKTDKSAKKELPKKFAHKNIQVNIPSKIKSPSKLDKSTQHLTAEESRFSRTGWKSPAQSAINSPNESKSVCENVHDYFIQDNVDIAQNIGSGFDKNKLKPCIILPDARVSRFYDYVIEQPATKQPSTSATTAMDYYLTGTTTDIRNKLTFIEDVSSWNVAKNKSESKNNTTKKAVRFSVQEDFEKQPKVAFQEPIEFFEYPKQSLDLTNKDYIGGANYNYLVMNDQIMDER